MAKEQGQLGQVPPVKGGGGEEKKIAVTGLILTPDRWSRCFTSKKSEHLRTIRVVTGVLAV